MKKTAAFLTILGALLVAPSAGAAVREIGLPPDFTLAGCPENCKAIGQITGYQVQNGEARNPFLMNREGKIVAFTIRLSRPNQEQVDFFTNLFGGPPRVRLAVLKPAKTKRRHRLVAQSEVFNLAPYLGSTPTFALDKPLTIERRNVIALSAPTWVPAFTSTGLGEDYAWRSSLPAGACEETGEQAAQQTEGSLRTYGCFYRTARLLYSATFVPKPSETTGEEQPAEGEQAPAG